MKDKDMNEKQLQYVGINGLRAYAAIGIAMMHIKVNGSYVIPGFVSENLIESMGELVFLFMIISGFSMCCGYYDKILNNEISVSYFYSKRYKKVWPYFALLCFIDVIISPSVNALYELFANLTLCFGLLPNANISVIGVGWFLGVVFVFYIIFPFFCYLISDSRRAWFSFGIALIFNSICQVYFFDINHTVTNFDIRSNFIYCSVFFITGGLIYLYKEQVVKFSTKFRKLCLTLCIILIICFVTIQKTVVIMLLLFSLMLIYSIGEYKNTVLDNSFTRFISNISMEIYLCHMIFFRIVEKLNLSHLFSNDLLSYIVCTIITLAGAITFSTIVKVIFKKIEKLYKSRVVQLN